MDKIYVVVNYSQLNGVTLSDAFTSCAIADLFASTYGGTVRTVEIREFKADIKADALGHR